MSTHQSTTIWNFTSARTCVVALAIGALSAGCFVGGDGDGDDEVGDDAGDEGPCVVVRGNSACALISSPLFGEFEACECYDDLSWQIFLDDDAPGHDFLMDGLIDAAIAQCETVVPNDQQPIICAVDNTVVSPAGTCVEEVCAEPPDDEAGDGVGDSVPPAAYGIASYDEVLECRGDSCTLERWFPETLLADPTLLLEDPARVIISSEGLRFGNVVSGSLAHAFGVHDGEVLRSINGQRLAGLHDVAAAAWRLADEERFVAELAGNAGTRRLVITLR